MFFGGGAVAVVWEDAGEVKCQCDGCARSQLFGNGIEDIRWKVSNSAIAGEEVGAEQESESFAVEAHVSVGVTREMDGTQTVPDVDKVAVVEPAVGNERVKCQNGSADSLQATCGDSRPAAIAGMTGVVLSVETRGGNPGAGLASNRADVEDMAEAPVGDDDAANGLMFPTAPAKCAMQKEAQPMNPESSKYRPEASRRT
jgi:hypothetical protein